jgi:hypothetical protein
VEVLVGKKCIGGAHDGADVYLEAHERECISNGGRVVKEETCIAETFAGPAGMDELVLFPLRLARSLFADSPIIALLNRANETCAAHAPDIIQCEDDLVARCQTLLVDLALRCTFLIQVRLDIPRSGDWSLDQAFVDEALSVIEQIKRATDAARLHQDLDAISALLASVSGRSYRQLSEMLAQRGMAD